MLRLLGFHPGTALERGLMYFFFFLFAIIGVFSAIMVITRKNVMHAALFLLLTFACVGATYVLLRAEMLAAVQVLVYAGAVTVLFLFAILLVNIPRVVRLRQWNRQTGLAVVIAGLTGLWLIIAMTRTFWKLELPLALWSNRLAHRVPLASSSFLNLCCRLRLLHSSCLRQWSVPSSWRAKQPWRRSAQRRTSPRRTWRGGHRLVGSLSNPPWRWRNAVVPLPFYLAFGALLFVIGVIGVLTRRNAIIVLMSIELMLNAVNLTLISFSHYLQDLRGQIFTLFIIAVAASEAAVGLALVISLYRGKATFNLDEVNLLKW